jgi:hypothetical protein
VFLIYIFLFLAAIYFLAGCFTMSDTPAAPSSSGTPPTSPQRHQQAARDQERAQHVMGSPEQRRTPATSSNTAVPTSDTSTSAVSAPVTFNGQTYHHLPPPLVAQLTALSGVSGAARQSGSLAPPPQVLTSAELAAAYAALPPLIPQNRRQQISVSLLY